MMSKNQLRRATRRTAAEMRKLRRALKVAEETACFERSLKVAYRDQLARERGLKDYPARDSIEGLAYWINNSIYGV